MITEEEKPLHIVPVGSSFQINKVILERAALDPLHGIQARGILTLNGRKLRTRYLWGIDTNIHKAPWESPEYNAQDEISIDAPSPQALP
jgi:hypothetical protein